MSVAGSEALSSGGGHHAAIQTNPHPSHVKPFASELASESSNATSTNNNADSSTPRTVPQLEEEGGNKKQKRRSLFGFVKKKSAGTDESKKSPPADTSASAAAAAPTSSTSGGPTSGSSSGQPSRQATSSPDQNQQQQSYHGRSTTVTPASPGRTLSSSPGRGGALSTSSPHLSPRLSPRLGSPAGSQIFERDVQESAALPSSPAIPSHITTENYIPPVLDASSEAITDERIDPDTVEIVTHTSHQPAALAVTGAGAGSSSSLGAYDHSMAASWAAELPSFEHDRSLPPPPLSATAPHHGHHPDGGAASLDSSPDIRRLSFISFADVVLSEQGHAGGLPPPTSGGSSAPGGATTPRDSIHIAGLTSLATTLNVSGANRSPSPIRSPVSSLGGAAASSPPTSKSGSVKGLDMSPPRKPAAGVTGAASPTTDGELKIETMSQALRRTGSSDLSGVRSLPVSPVEGPSPR